jgi:hypothetical protein
MNDLLLKTVQEIRHVAKTDNLQIFYGWLVEADNPLAVHWNRDNGGSWEKFLECAKIAGANILYLNWAPFEQFQIDDAVEELESKLAEDEEQTEGSDETSALVRQAREFDAKVGLTCVIDLAFVASGVTHIYQETADWFDKFNELLPENDEDDDRLELKPDRVVVDKWAFDLASNAEYFTSKQRDYLLEKLSGTEFPKLPVPHILRRAEIIFQNEFKEGAEKKLTEDIRQLREQGLNLNAIALRLGISRDRVSGFMPALPKRK